jgi:hypothetical protein
MANDIEITIHQAELDEAESELGLTSDDLKLFDNQGKIRVDVYVDGKLVESKKKANDSVTVKMPASAAGKISTVVVTTRAGKTLKILRYAGDKKITDKDSPDDGAALAKAIGEASDKIAAPFSKDQPLIAAINNLATAITNFDPGRLGSDAGGNQPKGGK